MRKVVRRLMLGGIAGGLALVAAGCGGGGTQTIHIYPAKPDHRLQHDYQSDRRRPRWRSPPRPAPALPSAFPPPPPGVCTVNGATNGAMASLMAAGTCTIQATQAGDALFQAAHAGLAKLYGERGDFQSRADNRQYFAHIHRSGIGGADGDADRHELSSPRRPQPTMGRPTTITFVNSTTITLTLSATDQAATGSEAIVLTNPAPGGGTASINLSVVSQLDTMLTNFRS
jgi:hypothetical protein